jgi:amino acid adenylation domain-containing protein
LIVSAAIAGLCSGLLRHAASSPTRPAVETVDGSLSYGELASTAAGLAKMLAAHDTGDTPVLAAVLASRTPVAYAGVVAGLLSGHGYVPLNPSFPAERNRWVLARSGAGAIIVDGRAVRVVEDLLAGCEERLLLVVPDVDDVSALRTRWAPHLVLGRGDLEPAEPPQAHRVDPADPAYLLFTSGSTGTPKGVLVTQGNVRAFLEAVGPRYGIRPDDRLSQTFDLTFDLSAFDMLMAWEHGACLCVPTAKDLVNASGFIRRAEPTIWFSVPSVAMFMRRLGVLKAGAFPTLRWSLFCGEGLPLDLARAWAEAAPNSLVENLYGPTEATIACTAYRLAAQPGAPAELGLVPIGEPLSRTRVLVVDEGLREVDAGEPGELLLQGPQVVGGYWRDGTNTAAAFARREDGPWYRTGDRVRRLGPDGPLAYLGRLDNQIKVLGHRVELGEVEAIVREETSADAVAIGWPRTESGAAGIVVFVADTALDSATLLARLRSRLPAFMLPREILLLEQLPLSANGKHDRNALLEVLEGR